MNFDSNHRTYEGIKLQICNIDQEVNYDMLYKELSNYGLVSNVELTERSKYSPVKTATVTYFSPGEAQKALRHLNGRRLLNNTLYVGIAREAQKRVRSRSYHNISGSISTANLGSSWNGGASNHGSSWNEGRSKFEQKDCPLDLSLPSRSAPELSNSPGKSVGHSLIDFKQFVAKRSTGIPSNISNGEKEKQDNDDDNDNEDFP